MNCNFKICNREAKTTLRKSGKLVNVCQECKKFYLDLKNGVIYF